MDDTLDTRNAAWTSVAVRAGWTGAGPGRPSPFIGVTNLFDQGYVSSVVLNAVGGRYYEPAPGRTIYVGLGFALGR